MINVPEENQHHYKIIPRNSELRLDIKGICDHPNRTLLIDWKGDCFLCPCEMWLPVSVGKITDFISLEQVWQNPSAKYLQDDIVHNRLFTHCAVDRCGIKDTNLVQTTYHVSINIDQSCNLRCPSCRKDHIMITSGYEYDHKLRQINHIMHLLENFNHPCHIVMTGNGDPLASAIMRPLLHQYRPRPNHTIRLFTNGLLLKKQLDGNPLLDHITEYMISIDAGSQEVYEKVRLGGSWEQLVKNFNWLRTIITGRKVRVMIMFVLQKDNYKDIANFCEFVLRYKFIGVITYLEDWGTWNNFQEQDVIGNKSNPLHTEAIEILRQNYKKYKSKIHFASKLEQALSNTLS